MSRIRGRETKPELQLRSALHGKGYRYRLHVRGLPGRPDIVLARYHAVIFVHGCFWHRHAGCKLAYRPKSNMAFWMEKFAGNVERDRKQIKELRSAGWRVLVVWECGIRLERERTRVIAETIRWLESGSVFKEIAAQSTG